MQYSNNKKKRKEEGASLFLEGQPSGRGVRAIESTSCAAERGNNGGGQLREQECALLIMWTGDYQSPVIGSQAPHQSREVSPRR